MNAHLKSLYGRRITPGVKIFMLVVVIFLGLHLSCAETRDGIKEHADKVMVE